MYIYVFNKYDLLCITDIKSNNENTQTRGDCVKKGATTLEKFAIYEHSESANIFVNLIMCHYYVTLVVF